jgi:hypothetical protein
MKEIWCECEEKSPLEDDFGMMCEMWLGSGGEVRTHDGSARVQCRTRNSDLSDRRS